MTTVFIAPKNFGTPTNAFKEKKIAHLCPGKVSDSPIRIIAPFFTYPTSWFKFVLHTILTNSVTTFSTGFTFNLFKNTPFGIAYDVPVCTFRFNRLSDAQRSTLKAIGMQQDLTNPNLFVGSPSPDNLKAINALAPIDDRMRPGHISYKGYFAWTFLIRGVQAFSVLRNTFKGEVNMAYELKKSVKFDKEGELKTISGTTYTGKAPDGKRAIGTTNEYFIGPDKDITLDLFGATPVEKLGDLSTVNGIFFQYFNGMSVPDKGITGRIFESFFTGCLADTVEMDAEMMSRVVQGSRDLAFSRTGMVLSHIYRCMEISTNVAGAMFIPVVRNNEYVGSIVTGEAWSVQQYGKTYTAGPIQESIDSLDILSSQSKKIAQLLNSVNSEDDAMEGSSPRNVVYQASDFLTSRGCLEQFHGIDEERYESTEVVSQVREIMLSMAFGDVFPVPTSKLVSLFVRAATSGDRTTLLNYPAYLSKSTLTKGSRIAACLAMFGPRAPACQILGRKGARVFNLTGNEKTDPNLIVDKETSKRRLQYLPIWVDVFGNAERTWTTLEKEGTIVIPEGRKGKKEFADTRAVVIQVGGEDFNDLYAAYTEMAKKAKAQKVASMKRKREDESGPSMEKRSRIADMVEDLL